MATTDKNETDGFSNALAKRYQREHNQAVGRSFRRLLKAFMEDAGVGEVDARVWLKNSGITEPVNGSK